MPRQTTSVTLTFPHSAVENVCALSEELTDRMHALLGRNTEETLSPVERAELETLVYMAQFGQIVSLARQASGKP